MRWTPSWIRSSRISELDPLINLMGGVNANDNSAAALLMGKFVSLAARRRMAVAVAHHAAKGRDPISAESAMGAASFINLTRIALGIEPLDQKDAEKLGLPPWEAKSVFRVLGTKQNFSPPQETDRWYRLRSYEIQNQQPPIYPTGDRVAVVEIFLPNASGPTFPLLLIRDALTAVDRAAPPLSLIEELARTLCGTRYRGGDRVPSRGPSVGRRRVSQSSIT